MDKKEKMFELVKQWRTSNTTRKVFALKHGITEPSFDYWCSKYDNEQKVIGNRLGFVEITPPKPLVHQDIRHPQIELELPNGLRIKIY